jgi:hypothetical protein
LVAGNPISAPSVKDQSHLSKFKSPFPRPLTNNLARFQSSAAGNLLAATLVVTVEQSRTIKLRAAMIVTIAVYTLAVGGSAFLNVKQEAKAKWRFNLKSFRFSRARRRYWRLSH